MPTVVVMGTLDTKGAELQYVQRIIAESGLNTLLMDTGRRWPGQGART